MPTSARFLVGYISIQLPYDVKKSAVAALAMTWGAIVISGLFDPLLRGLRRVLSFEALVSSAPAAVPVSLKTHDNYVSIQNDYNMHYTTGIGFSECLHG